MELDGLFLLQEEGAGGLVSKKRHRRGVITSAFTMTVGKEYGDEKRGLDFGGGRKVATANRTKKSYNFEQIPRSAS